jgi:hypothetical protein
VSTETPSTCKLPTAALASSFGLKDADQDDRDGVTWRWGKGAETAAAAFGDPTSATNYQLCVFDESGPSPTLLFESHVPPGGTCGAKPCWRGLGKPVGSKGWLYQNRSGTAGGITMMSLKQGGEGKAKISLMGKGVPLVLPGENAHAALPLPPPRHVRVQLRANNQCWEASFSDAGVLMNDGVRFTAKGP